MVGLVTLRRCHGQSPQLHPVLGAAPRARLPDALHGGLRVSAAAQEAGLQSHRHHFRQCATHRALRETGDRVETRGSEIGAGFG